MKQGEPGHQPRCPHCGEPLRVTIAYQVAKPNSWSRDFQTLHFDGRTEEVEFFTKSELARMANEADAANDQHEMHQRWRGY